MKFLPRNGHILRIWFDDLQALLDFRTKYLENVSKVKTNYTKSLLDNKNGYIFVVDKE